MNLKDFPQNINDKDICRSVRCNKPAWWRVMDCTCQLQLLQEVFKLLHSQSLLCCKCNFRGVCSLSWAEFSSLYCGVQVQVLVPPVHMSKWPHAKVLYNYLKSALNTFLLTLLIQWAIWQKLLVWMFLGKFLQASQPWICAVYSILCNRTPRAPWESMVKVGAAISAYVWAPVVPLMTGKSSLEDTPVLAVLSCWKVNWGPVTLL